MKPGRNEKCPCGSGKKRKRCHPETELTLRAKAQEAERAAEHERNPRASRVAVAAILGMASIVEVK